MRISQKEKQTPWFIHSLYILVVHTVLSGTIQISSKAPSPFSFSTKRDLLNISPKWSILFLKNNNNRRRWNKKEQTKNKHKRTNNNNITSQDNAFKRWNQHNNVGGNSIDSKKKNVHRTIVDGNDDGTIQLKVPFFFLSWHLPASALHQFTRGIYDENTYKYLLCAPEFSVWQ